MGEFQALLDFPGTEAGCGGAARSAQGQRAGIAWRKLFYGKAACAGCHAPPYFTDNLMHNLKVERFYDPKLVNGVMASADGPIKTFRCAGSRIRRRTCTTTAC